MTNQERLNLLRDAEAVLKKTTKGYVQAGTTGVNWKDAMAKLSRLENELLWSVLLNIMGPVFKGGKSLLLQDLTHPTSGIPLYPAFDDAFEVGTPIIAPEPLVVVEPLTSSSPGKAFYADGKVSGMGYWFGHLDRSPKIGTNFKLGAFMAKVAPNSIGGGPHVHVGINVENILGSGKQFEHHTNYTHGAPLILTQIKKALLG